jgi:phosphoribosylaminoimidazole (AIR) synthetase
MGIGMAIIVSARDAKNVGRQLRAKQIGRIEPGAGKTELIF